MLNSGKKIPLRATKKINILTLVLPEKQFLNETINHNLPPPPPPCKLNGRSLNETSFNHSKSLVCFICLLVDMLLKFQLIVN